MKNYIKYSIKYIVELFHAVQLVLHGNIKKINNKKEELINKYDNVLTNELDTFKKYFDYRFGTINSIRKNTGIILNEKKEFFTDTNFVIDKSILKNTNRDILISILFELNTTPETTGKTEEDFSKKDNVDNWKNPCENIEKKCNYDILFNDVKIFNKNLIKYKEAFQIEQKPYIEKTKKRKGKWGSVLDLVLGVTSLGIFTLISESVKIFHQLVLDGNIPNWDGNDWSEHAGPSFNPFKGINVFNMIFDKLKIGNVVSKISANEYKKAYINYLKSLASGGCMYSDGNNYPTDIVNKNGGKQFYSNLRCDFVIEKEDISNLRNDLKISFSFDGEPEELIKSIILKVETCYNYFNKKNGG